MAQLKRWESPRRSGRNDKGRGGSARQKQLRKRNRALRRRLKTASPSIFPPREVHDLSFFLAGRESPKISQAISLIA